MLKKVVQRSVDRQRDQLGDLDPVLKRIYLSRGIYTQKALDYSLKQLPSPSLLSGMETMVAALLAALKANKKILILADFDADGATSCAVAIKGLRLLGAQQVSYVVPNRFEYGYGLTPEIVALAAQSEPDIIITVDNGISSFEGVEAARKAGIQVLITDHHLPGMTLPPAQAIVNPNVEGDAFPSKALAGVGVIFYVLLALRAQLRAIHWFSEHQMTEPNLAQLLDLVALGTIADVVPLDYVNRILVFQGLSRIKSGHCCAGINSLIEISGRNPKTLSATDLGFAIGPRLNAAGRLDDMALGIECLLSSDPIESKQMAQQLDHLNKERKEIEAQMKSSALSILATLSDVEANATQSAVCLYDQQWHQGVIGILASRIKDKLNRPVIAFAKADHGYLKGSARSISEIHIRDVLNDIATENPQLLSKFGGHAMAAGLTIKACDFDLFTKAFIQRTQQLIADFDLTPEIYTDGQLTEDYLTLNFTELIAAAGPWGQKHPEPFFDGIFDVLQIRIVGERHLKLVLRLPLGGKLIDAIYFFVDKPESWLGVRQIKAVYKLDTNEFRGQRNLQFILQHIIKIT
ncbi:MAG TPA: single-stranded-DNA-specific exonuclease RecJ [Methylococcales bacterium]|jgi:single-stranded-DNA-specific exonuclease|nr:single-stranded-DNA-specific exonuclease RecJ [Methylococcales bacterium]